MLARVEAKAMVAAGGDCCSATTIAHMPLLPCSFLTSGVEAYGDDPGCLLRVFCKCALYCFLTELLELEMRERRSGGVSPDASQSVSVRGLAVILVRGASEVQQDNFSRRVGIRKRTSSSLLDEASAFVSPEADFDDSSGTSKDSTRS